MFCFLDRVLSETIEDDPTKPQEDLPERFNDRYHHEEGNDGSLFADIARRQESAFHSYVGLNGCDDDVMNLAEDQDEEDSGNSIPFEKAQKNTANVSEIGDLTDQVRLLTSQVYELKSEQLAFKRQLMQLHKPPVASTTTFVADIVKAFQPSFCSMMKEISDSASKQRERIAADIVNAFEPSFSLITKEIGDLALKQKETFVEVNKLSQSSLAKISAEDIIKVVLTGVNPELISLKEQIRELHTEAIKSMESLVHSLDKSVKDCHSTISKDVGEIAAKQKKISEGVENFISCSLPKTPANDISEALIAEIKLELNSFIDSVNVAFSKIDFKINVPEEFIKVSESVANLSSNVSSIVSTVTTICQRPVQLCSEMLELPSVIQNLNQTVKDILTFKMDIDRYANLSKENLSIFNYLAGYFNNLQNDVRVLQKQIEQIIPSKKERKEDRELFDVLTIDQKVLKDKVSKIADSMLLLVRWAESIMVDNSASTSKTNVEGDRPPFKQPFSDRNVTELPLEPESNVNSVSNIPEETTTPAVSRTEKAQGKTNIEGDRSPFKQPFSDRNVTELPLEPESNVNSVSNIPEETTTPPPVSHSEKSFNNAKEQGKDATKSHDRKDHYGKPVIAELPLDPKSTVNPASHPCQDTSSSLSEQQPPRHETSIDGEKVQEKKLKYLTSSACRHPVLMEASKTILVKKIQKKLLGSRKPTQHMPTR